MITTTKGIYIGDICYVLDEEAYYGYWEKVQNFNEGSFKNILGIENGSFEVYSTAFGDGVYDSTDGHHYPVDAGVIGIVTQELLDVHMRTDDSKELGTFIEFNDGEEHTAELEYEDGTFRIYVDNDIVSEIYTGDYEEEDYEEEEEY